METTKHFDRCVDLIDQVRNQPSGSVEIIVKDKTLSIRFHHRNNFHFPLVCRLTQDQLQRGLTAQEWLEITKTLLHFIEKGIL